MRRLGPAGDADRQLPRTRTEWPFAGTSRTISRPFRASHPSKNLYVRSRSSPDVVAVNRFGPCPPPLRHGRPLGSDSGGVAGRVVLQSEH
jgi:hypothetical protein